MKEMQGICYSGLVESWDENRDMTLYLWPFLHGQVKNECLRWVTTGTHPSLLHCWFLVFHQSLAQKSQLYIHCMCLPQVNSPVVLVCPARACPLA